MQSQSSWTALFPPLTLMYAASMLREAGHEVSLVDAIAQERSIEQVLAHAEAFHPELLVLNTAFPSIHGDMGFARACAERVRGLRSVAVGVVPTVMAREILVAYPWVDFIVLGEPERALVALAGRLQRGEQVDGLRALGWRVDGEIQVSDQHDYSDDLDALPLPDRDTLPPHLYRFPLTDEPLTMISFARGCPYSCIYCLAPLYYGKKYRRRSAESMLAEMRVCVERHRIRAFIFWGELVSMHPDHLHALCDGILASGMDVLWMAAARADQLDEALVRKMRSSGCHMVTLGLESASQEVLDRSRKALSLEDCVRGIGLLRDAGIKVMGHFVIGLPGETEETARATRDFAKKHCDYAQFYCAVPYPGTELAEMAAREGWLSPVDWAQYDFMRGLIDREGMSGQRMEELRRKAFLEFYMRPQVVWDNLRQMKWQAVVRRLSFKEWVLGR